MKLWWRRLLSQWLTWVHTQVTRRPLSCDQLFSRKCTVAAKGSSLPYKNSDYSRSYAFSVTQWENAAHSSSSPPRAQSKGGKVTLPPWEILIAFSKYVLTLLKSPTRTDSKWSWHLAPPLWNSLWVGRPEGLHALQYLSPQRSQALSRLEMRTGPSDPIPVAVSSHVKIVVAFRLIIVPSKNCSSSSSSDCVIVLDFSISLRRNPDMKVYLSCMWGMSLFLAFWAEVDISLWIQGQPGLSSSSRYTKIPVRTNNKPKIDLRHKYIHFFSSPGIDLWQLLASFIFPWFFHLQNDNCGWCIQNTKSWRAL